ncbi:whirlin isoform X2 [Anthonomus grandis grandis]|uniref:whirlin isoform X2 n=1 Tax=Anthonomus grandis grandis TaxID=2921223 RepID=UPI002166B90A|nr:whirlin isoform X2 [Anthonomus grandis grandis]
MRVAGGDEYAELAELGGGYGTVAGVGTNVGPTRGRRVVAAGRSNIPAEAEDALGPHESPRRPRSGLYYSPPGTSYTIVERPSSALHHHREYREREHHYSSLSSPRGTYLGSNPNFHSTTGGGSSSRTPANNKKRPISPEQVLRLFGTGNHATPKSNSDRSRRSPVSSPPSATHNYRPPVYSPSIHELATRTVNMVRDPQDPGFGICVKGGKEAGVGVYISRVEEGSVAERSGLRPGDSILEVNGTPFTGISHEEALKMLKSCRKISMTVRTPNLPGTGSMACSGAPWQMRQTCSWMDRHGRPVSPPLEYSRGRHSHGRTGSKDRTVRRVDLCIEPGQSLGLMIRGGVEYNLGIFITGVDKESVADRAGLMVGDQILEVNGQSFMDVTHDEAVAQLKYHKRMSLVVRDVGKVPHSCTAYDREFDLCSPGSRLAAASWATRKWAAALQAVEEKARILLNRPEFGALVYYTDEYAARHMTVDAFVQCMTELLNTPDKYTLMTELREIVALEDRQKFDELVYRRNEEMPRSRDPREHDYRHSRRKGAPIPDQNHTSYQGFHEEYGPGDIPVYNDENNYRSPSEDSGLGMGFSDKQNSRIRPPSGCGKTVADHNQDGQQEFIGEEEEHAVGSRRHSSPGESRSGSTTQLHQQDYADSELAHKLSRSFDMKEDASMLEGEGVMRRHQSMQRLNHGPNEPREPPRVQQDEEGNLRVTVKKTKPILGIAIEGGANTKHPLPRIININENGAAYCCGGLEVGQLILSVDGTRVEGLQHQDVARLIAESFARRDRNDIEFTVIEAKKSNMEPKPTALIFLEA